MCRLLALAIGGLIDFSCAAFNNGYHVQTKAQGISHLDRRPSINEHDVTLQLYLLYGKRKGLIEGLRPSRRRTIRVVLVGDDCGGGCDVKLVGSWKKSSAKHFGWVL